MKQKRKYIREGSLFTKLSLKKKTKRESVTDSRDSKRDSSLQHRALLKEMFSKKNQKAPYWFLMSDILVYCESKKSDDGKLFEFRITIPLEDVMHVRELRDGEKSKGSAKTSFVIELADNEVLAITAETVEEKNKWMRDVMLLVNVAVILELSPHLIKIVKYEYFCTTRKKMTNLEIHLVFCTNLL